jgi:hypothetical protein
LRSFAQVLLLIFTISAPLAMAYVYESSSLGVTQTIKHRVVNASWVNPIEGKLPRMLEPPYYLNPSNTTYSHTHQ